MTILTALTTLGSEQDKTTINTIKGTYHLLDYLATHPDAKIGYYASDMVLNIHLDASYASEIRARSCADRHFFLGWIPWYNTPIRLNGAIYTFFNIMKSFAYSAAEAELDALFMNAKEGRIIRLTLEELGHTQIPTPINCDNATEAGIANFTVKRQRSRLMKIRYVYICDQVKKGKFVVMWHSWKDNWGDYASQHHDDRHHQNVRALYLQERNSPHELP